MHIVSAVVGLLLLAYAGFWLVTAGDRFSSEPWGSKALARHVHALCNLVFARMMGVDFVVVHDGDVDRARGRTAVVAASPHGAFPLSQVGLGMLHFRLSPFPGVERYLVGGASILFCVPLLREFLLICGVRSAERRTLRRLLGSGITVALNPGGNHEMTCTRHDREQIFAQRGLGFVRLAIECGAPVVPAYAFGENQLFHTHSQLESCRLWLVRRWRIGAPIFTGRWGVPYLIVPVRRASRVTLVIGRPVEVGAPDPSPSAEKVEAVFADYVAEVARIFSTHAARYLPAEVAARGLRIERIGHGLVRHVDADDVAPAARSRVPTAPR